MTLCCPEFLVVRPDLFLLDNRLLSINTDRALGTLDGSRLVHSERSSWT